MPRRKFVYSREAGGVVEVTPAAELEKCAEITADVASRTEPLDFAGSGYRRDRPTWPRVSDSMGCNPCQIPDDQKFLAEHGVYTEYTSEGQPIFRDAKHRREHMRAFGYADVDAGYSDRAPENFSQADYDRIRRR